MASVFLSYSREDVAKAQAVAAALERLGHSVWWDRQVHGGSRFSQEVERALKRSDAIVVLWSQASIESAWVILFEPTLAGARRTPQFAQMMQRYGLVSYWRQSRQKPDFCKEASPPQLCASL